MHAAACSHGFLLAPYELSQTKKQQTERNESLQVCTEQQGKGVTGQLALLKPLPAVLRFHTAHWSCRSLDVNEAVTHRAKELTSAWGPWQLINIQLLEWLIVQVVLFAVVLFICLGWEAPRQCKGWGTTNSFTNAEMFCSPNGCTLLLNHFNH